MHLTLKQQRRAQTPKPLIHRWAGMWPRKWSGRRRSLAGIGNNRKRTSPNRAEATDNDEYRHKWRKLKIADVESACRKVTSVEAANGHCSQRYDRWPEKKLVDEVNLAIAKNCNRCGNGCSKNKS